MGEMMPAGGGGVHDVVLAMESASQRALHKTCTLMGCIIFTVYTRCCGF